MEDLEYAQWFYQCNLKVHGLCASLLYFYLRLAVGCYSSQFGKLCEEAEDSFFQLSGELFSMLLSKPLLGGLEMTCGRMYTVKTRQEFILGSVNSRDTIKLTLYG